MPNVVKDDSRPDRWQVRWREDGKQKKKRGFRTRKEAEAWLFMYQKKQEEAALAADAEPKVPDLTFDDLLSEWYDYERTRIKESSLYTIQSKISAQVLPFFTGKVVKDIKPLDVLRWQQSLSGFSHSYQIAVRSKLVSIYRYAAKYHDIPNIMEKVDAPRNLEAKTEMQVWTPEQMAAFLACEKSSTYHLFFELLYVLGCRKGELQALTWADIDADADTVHICHTVTNKTTAGSWAVTTPKNRASDRRVRIPSPLMQDLIAFRGDAPYTAFVFGGSRPLPEQTITWHFQRATEAAGLPKIRIHDIRHSCASMLISQGIDIVTVSKRLGHSNIKQTLDTYSHMMPSAEQRAVDVFGHILGTFQNKP